MPCKWLATGRPEVWCWMFSGFVFKILSFCFEHAWTSLYYNVNIRVRGDNIFVNNTWHGFNFLFQYSRKMSLQQSVVEPPDASFTELIQATDDTPNLLSCGICNKRYKAMSIFAEFVQACSKQRLSILNTSTTLCCKDIFLEYWNRKLKPCHVLFTKMLSPLTLILTL
jgi:hypothetical protein